MEWTNWIAGNWVDLLQSAGIVANLFLSLWVMRREAHSQRASNIIRLTEQHRDLWKELFARPSLSRVLKKKADLARDPLTDDESVFVGLLVLHLNSTYVAIEAGIIKRPDGLAPDIRGFFSLPVPNAVWKKTRHLHDADFVAFVEAQLGGVN
jgi:hypothetical protein